MVRAMFSGVSGLRAHQTRMDVIGNNIANVNTIGFKSSRVTFSEVFNQTVKGASSPDSTTGRGGTNPMQIGLGMGVGSVDTITTRGSLQRTDNPTDLSIEGEGFFIVRAGSTGTYMFTRAGNFTIDEFGNLTASNGMNVQGWQSYTRTPTGEYIFDTEKPIEALNLYADVPNKNKRMIAAQATTVSTLTGNLDASANAVGAGNEGDDNVSFSAPMTIYDSLGNDYKINVNFWKISADATGTTWTWNVSTEIGMTAAGATGTIQFDPLGQIVSGAGVTPTITVVPDPAIGAEDITIDLDFGKITMFSGVNSVRAVSDGYPTGTLTSYSIGADGVITGIYSNGRQQPLGMIALAVFENPAGMQKVGDNMFIPSTNSGEFTKACKAGTDGSGTLNPGTLETSNVDLSREFTDMIVTQRGFQANSRIITTTDEMLQDLVNLKR